MQLVEGKTERDVETKERAERRKGVYQFPVAAITNRHKLSGIK